jgi:integrase
MFPCRREVYGALLLLGEVRKPLPQAGYSVPTHFTRSFKPFLKCAGLPHSVRFHDLRHTCATLLLSKGVHPKLVQELLGHSNVSITLDTYSHVLPGMGNQAANAIDDSLS